MHSNTYTHPTLIVAPSAVARQGRVIKSAGRRIIPESVAANIDIPKQHSKANSLHALSMIATGLCVGGLCALMFFLPSGEPYRKQSSKLLSFIAKQVEQQLAVTSAHVTTTERIAVSHRVRDVEHKKTYPKLSLIPAPEVPKEPLELSKESLEVAKEAVVVVKAPEVPQSMRLASFSVSTREPAQRLVGLPEIASREVRIDSSAHPVHHRSAISRVFSIIRKYAPKNQSPHVLAEAIVKESRRQAYDPLFVAAVIKAESTFNATARSHKGAQGLMQIMPATGAWIASREDLPRGKLTDPGHNLKLGITYLKHLDEQFEGNKIFTLVAYNWGPGHVQKATGGKKRIPRECLTYALKILNDYKRWQSGLI